MQLNRLSALGGQRFAERRSLGEGTTLRVDNRPSTIEMLNLSTTGCLIQTNVALEPGMEVRIGLRGVGSFAAQVVRTDGLVAGCQFHKPLQQQDLDNSFKNNVIFQDWKITTNSGEEGTAEAPLAPRTKLAVIVGLSLVLWAIIGFSAYKMF